MFFPHGLKKSRVERATFWHSPLFVVVEQWLGFSCFFLVGAGNIQVPCPYVWLDSERLETIRHIIARGTHTQTVHEALCIIQRCSEKSHYIDKATTVRKGVKE